MKLRYITNKKFIFQDKDSINSPILNIELKAPNWILKKFSIGYNYEIYFLENMNIIYFTNNLHKYKKEKIMII